MDIRWYASGKAIGFPEKVDGSPSWAVLFMSKAVYRFQFMYILSVKKMNKNAIVAILATPSRYPEPKYKKFRMIVIIKNLTMIYS